MSALQISTYNLERNGMGSSKNNDLIFKKIPWMDNPIIMELKIDYFLRITPILFNLYFEQKIIVGAVIITILNMDIMFIQFNCFFPENLLISPEFIFSIS